MKGIILAGGTGSRLYPITKGISKQLVPIYDKPMIYYPLSVLMLSGIKEVLIITTPSDLEQFKRLLGTGENLGIHLSYKVQIEPKGLADAFIIGEEFIGEDSVCLVLGDNIFYGQGLTEILNKAVNLRTGALIFGYYVKNPKDYGVVQFDNDGNVLGIEEKPNRPKSNYAVPGLYFYDNKVIDIAKSVKPSARGEIEISSVNECYLEQNELKVEIMGRGMAWLDTGTHKSLLEASNYIEAVQNRQGLYVASLEEIAYRKGYINEEQLYRLALPLSKTDYGSYLLDLAAKKEVTIK
ncbi:glucose-1-phosphate thymidylyltransferase RfbA [Bacillus pumilus]|uniref:glucose-1-phosphate thymidylyltransferase RfbA n=1 Tax=Bacillus pumilus TaxID=1408 RepID=UPI0025A157FB|nr:glucose-1-phosphate thymidylyltransferase RfbA [Bacillus pumilus]MDM5321651.1 glucose-1-phosphate thymidylyltransferase RfbA [Bacillus pumilus]